jgi:hypothetical protein
VVASEPAVWTFQGIFSKSHTVAVCGCFWRRTRRAMLQPLAMTVDAGNTQY